MQYVYSMCQELSTTKQIYIDIYLYKYVIAALKVLNINKTLSILSFFLNIFEINQESYGKSIKNGKTVSILSFFLNIFEINQESYGKSIKNGKNSQYFIIFYEYFWNQPKKLR